MNLIEKEIIKNIYQYRSITLDQIKTYLGGSEEEVAQLITSGYITENTHEELIYYFLTGKGAHKAKDLFRIKKKKRMEGSRGYVTASKLSFKPRIARHQLGVAEFMFQFHQRFPNLTKDVFEFLDGGVLREDIKKHASPDGWIRVGDIEIFLEIDRGTETQPAIREKMKNYVRFAESQSYQQDRKIIILFCYLDNPTERRKKMIMNCAVEGLDLKLKDSFDFVMGDMERCLTFLKEEVIYPMNPASLRKSQERMMARLPHTLEPYLRFKLYNTDYRNNVALDQTKRHYYFIDLTTQRASRFATLNLLEEQLRSVLFRDQTHFVIHSDRYEQIDELKKLYPNITNHPYAIFLHTSQLKDFQENPLSFY